MVNIGIEGMDPVTEDILWKDEPGPSLVHLDIPGRAGKLLGALFVPKGEGPHPVALILHGFPGHDRNLDIAHVLKRGGIASLVFHYRGCWGSGGPFSFTGMIEDVGAALDNLDDRSGDLGLDTKEPLLIGHSMGGWAALMTASGGRQVKGVASLAGFNLGLVRTFAMGDEVSEKFTAEGFRALMSPVKGPTAEELVEELIEQGKDWDLTGRVEELLSIPLLLIAAKEDTLALPDLHYYPLLRRLEEEGHKCLKHKVLPSDHSFSGSRISLSREVWEWARDIVH